MVTWYFDLISPFSWLALPEVEALGLPVAYRPVLLGALLKHWGQLGPAEIAPKRILTYRLCVWLATERGVPFRMPPVHPFNPLRAMRLLTAVGPEAGTVRAAVETIWAEGTDVGEPEGFGTLAARLRAPTRRGSLRKPRPRTLCGPRRRAPPPAACSGSRRSKWRGSYSGDLTPCRWPGPSWRIPGCSPGARWDAWRACGRRAEPRARLRG